MDGGWDHITRDHIMKGVQTIKLKSTEERERINKSKARIGQNNGMYGVKRSGAEAPRFGMKNTELSKTKASIKMSNKTYGKDLNGTIFHIECSDIRLKDGER